LCSFHRETVLLGRSEPAATSLRRREIVAHPTHVLFLAHELRPIGGHAPDIDALRGASSRIVSAAGETSGEEAGRRAAVALAERLGIEVTYLPGAHGGWGSDPQEFADRVDKLLRP
jgi:hypothetical protein